MEIVFIYLQAIGVLFGYNILKHLENPTKIQMAKVIFITVLPSILYINLKILGIK